MIVSTLASKQPYNPTPSKRLLLFPLSFATMSSLPIVDSIDAKMMELRDALSIAGSENIEPMSCLGRVLAEPVLAFRDSPATNVSAMDGFALRWDDLAVGPLPIQTTLSAGARPVSLKSGHAIRILTGAVVPDGADVVIRKEDSFEHDNSVRFSIVPSDVKRGLNIRYQGENAKAGDSVLEAGVLIGAQTLAGIVTFSSHETLSVRRKLKVAIINTGDELVPWGHSLAAWQIRDSNGPFLESALKQFPWCDGSRCKVRDSLDAIREQLAESLATSDAILLTGGVSMGETDFVPRAIQEVGGRVVFHRIPIRPGKPLLGAATLEGKLILGLPGNPLSVAVTFRRYGQQLLTAMAGCSEQVDAPKLETHCLDQKTLDLVWFRLVRRLHDGSVEVIPSVGSGDIASLARSDGFVEVPPGETTAGTRRFFAW
jgi:molybdopterin molybdotransferase